MARQTATLVQYLKLEDLARPELDELIEALRYHDAEIDAIDRSALDERAALVLDRDKLTLKMSEAEAQAQVRLAEREKRLRIEWKRGWIYFFLDPYTLKQSRDAAKAVGIPYDMGDMAHFLTKVPRKGGPVRTRGQHQALLPTRRR